MDMVLRLREARRLRGLSQKDAARLSGVGEKSISSFETGQRIGSLKISQLRRLLAVYGLTEREFFGGAIEQRIAPWDVASGEAEADRVLNSLGSLPRRVQKSLLGKFQLMIETATDLHAHGSRRPSFASDSEDWELLASRN
jgi:transcriptional regulator with XRE-family HTH domain